MSQAQQESSAKSEISESKSVDQSPPLIILLQEIVSQTIRSKLNDHAALNSLLTQTERLCALTK